MLAPVPKRPSPSAILTFTAAFSLSMGAFGCKGVVNASPELRWFLFSNFGAKQICPEMLKQGVPLRLQDRSPALGRFFPTGCDFNVDDSRQVITLHVSGTGYGYMNPAKRVGFSLTTSVEYRPDFQIAGDDVYVWGKLNRIVQGPNFQLGFVENRLVDVAANVPPFGTFANFVGNQVVSSALTRGFTVVHNDDTGNEFTLGAMFPPTKPHHPFEVTSNEKYTFANDTAEIHQNERDYMGPFEVAKAGQSLYLTFQLQGPPVDVMIVDKRTGDVWREGYQTGQPLGPPPGPIVAGAPLQPNAPDNRKYPLPPGQYYVVIDNTNAAGAVAPPPPTVFNVLADNVALLNYVVQLGE
jgi:hypothetical protein